jgi:hypothetical protein
VAPVKAGAAQQVPGLALQPQGRRHSRGAAQKNQSSFYPIQRH